MKSRRENKLVVLFLWIAVLGPQAAAFTNQPLTVRTLASHDRFRPGEAYRLAVVLEIASPWHVNANPASAGLIPTTVTLKLPAGWSLEDIDYPAGDAVRPHWASEPIRLYSGQVPIMIDVRVGENATTGPVTVSGNLRYQACDDRRCLAPTTLPLEWTLQVVPGGTPVIPQHAELFQPESVPQRVDSSDPQRRLRPGLGRRA